jgi:hypothetical protein
VRREPLEAVRARFGRPVIVSSGFRSLALNVAVGGSRLSQHLRGEAADFIVRDTPLPDVWAWVRDESGLAYGQVLLEGRAGRPGWIHLSLGEPWRPREQSRQALVVEV